MEVKFARSLCMILIGLMLTTGLSGFVVTAEDPTFEIDVFTRPRSAEISDPIIYQAIPGQTCIFLVTAFNLTGGIESVKITAKADGGMCEGLTVYPEIITPAQVAEITVIPKRSSVGETIPIEITGKRSGVSVTEVLYIQVFDGTDNIRGIAEGICDTFIPWVSENYPEIEIDENTILNPTIVRPGILVVQHYMFLTEEWEIYMTWHCMIPPYDWSRVYLRHRYTDIGSSYAFEDSSRTDEIPWIAIELPDWV